MEAAPLYPPAPLEKSFDVSGFDSGATELDDWLREYAWTNHASHNARVFVARRGKAVVGYYTLSTAGVAKDEFPPELSKGGVPKEVPCVLIGRMAVDRTEQGAGLGRGMLRDALLRVVRVSEEVAIRALLIHARDDDARSWYLHQVRSFRASPTDSHHLFLPMKELRRLASEST